MKKRYSLIILILMVLATMNAALILDQPVNLQQPDGTWLALYASGDEYYNYLHDAEGYTIMQHPETGFFVYAVSDKGSLSASEYNVHEYEAAALPISAGLRISESEYRYRRQLFAVPSRYQSRAPTEGTLNNLVVYIRFADQTEFPEPRSVFDPLFNADDGITPSMLSYYEEVSYNLLTISSTHYPLTDMQNNLSYQDEEPRAYYSPYNAVTNPLGYSGWEERAIREQVLLANAVAYIESQVPPDLDIDGDDDNRVDNVCFIIRGGNDNWADLLWAHRWSLYMVEAYINGLRVMDFTFQPRTQVNVGTLNHEMFHALGAPDLYHYNTDVYAPAAMWDIMEGGNGHMSGYMKYRYGNWIEEIPLISSSGTYSLAPLTEADNNIYRINSSNPLEYFVLEYRRRVPSSYEMNLPSEGLLIWRVDATLHGEGNADGPPDELYVYRPGGTGSTNGNPSAATFNADYGRTEFNDATNPADWLQHGGYGGIFIHQTGSAGDSISFIYNPVEGFIVGSISSNLEDVDYTEGIISLGTAEIQTNEAGAYSYMYYEGVYEAIAWLPGHGTETVELEIIANDVIMQDFELYYLEHPYNLSAELEGSHILLEWCFDGYDYENFEQFAGYIRLGDNAGFQQIFLTTDGYYETTLSSIFDYAFYVEARYENGNSEPSNIVEVIFSSDYNTETLPSDEILLQNYPNPFNPQTTIGFFVTTPEMINLSIYDIKGRLVKTLANHHFPEGHHSIIWHGDDNLSRSVSGGIYFYRLSGENKVSHTQKMILIK
jgi:M6 family metalloprotease-like protein